MVTSSRYYGGLTYSPTFWTGDYSQYQNQTGNALNDYLYTPPTVGTAWPATTTTNTPTTAAPSAPRAPAQTITSPSGALTGTWRPEDGNGGQGEDNAGNVTGAPGTGNPMSDIPNALAAFNEEVPGLMEAMALGPLGIPAAAIGAIGYGLANAMGVMGSPASSSLSQVAGFGEAAQTGMPQGLTDDQMFGFGMMTNPQTVNPETVENLGTFDDVQNESFGGDEQGGSKDSTGSDPNTTTDFGGMDGNVGGDKGDPSSDGGDKGDTSGDVGGGDAGGVGGDAGGDNGGSADGSGNGGGDGSSDADGMGGSWRYGGPTGDDGDGYLSPIRGTLHEGEFVLRPEAVAMYGYDMLHAMNEGRMQPNALAATMYAGAPQRPRPNSANALVQMLRYG
jgi:hypothetical protein